ncbi:MAG: hypothetical protein U1F98_17310 [Verrucomicrobiota bacterium]
MNLNWIISRVYVRFYMGIARSYVGRKVRSISARSQTQPATGTKGEIL